MASPARWISRELAQAFAAPASASAGLVVGVVFIIAGLAFKLSAVPFHMWTPDVYEGAPTPVTAFMSTAPKVAAMALLLRALEVPFGHLLAQWSPLIVLISIASMILGALAAIGQTQHQAADGLFLDRPYRLRADRASPSAPQAGIRGVLIYHGHLRVHERRRVRLHHRHAPPRPVAGADRRPLRASRRPTRCWRWPWPSSCSAWPASRRSRASSASSTCSSPRCRRAIGRSR